MERGRRGFGVTKVALLWESRLPGLSGNEPFDPLQRATGQNDAGMAFTYAMLRHLDADVTHLPRNVRAEQLADCDVVVIGCATPIPRNADLSRLAKTLEKADKPVAVIGLGLQGDDAGGMDITDGTREWIRVVASKRSGDAPNIYTRGPQTVRHLAQLGVTDAIPGACPSLFTNPARDLGTRIHARWSAQRAPRAVAVTGGPPAWVKYRRVEQQLVSMMMDPHCPGQYVVPSTPDMIRLALGEAATLDPKVLSQVHQHIVPHYNAAEFAAWCRTYARSFPDVPAWMDMLRRHDLTIGPRYYGAALAMQAERMAVTVTVDARTEEMCTQTGVPFLRAANLGDKLLTRTSLRSMIAFDPVAYDTTRLARAREYVDFLAANGITPSAALGGLVTEPQAEAAA